ncbi:MAG: methyl-accepting chemotaxis protein [Telluria sp.]
MTNSGLTIRARLALGFGGVFLLMIILGALASARVNIIDSTLSRINDVNNVKQRYAINFRGSVHDRAIALRDVVLSTDAGAAAPHIALIKTLEKNYTDSAGPLDAMFAAQADISDEEKAALAGIKASESKTQPLVARVIELRNADNIAEASALLASQAAPAFVEWLASINRLIDLEEKMNKGEAAYATELAHSFQVWMLALCAVAIAIGSAAAWYISRGLLRQLGGEPGYAAQIAGSIAAGDLAVDIRTDDGDEGSLLLAMKGMRDSLVGIVSQVRTGTGAIATASVEITAGNHDLSARTEAQAGTLEETASSMEELTGTVRQNADNARQANLLAVSASEVAVKGGAVVSQVVDTMASINESSKKIVDIIGVIDGIAFQTNILALNAAVEAARAGEQGRGFAVVATEVRNLAQRSAAAAKEIKTLINDSVQKVDAGGRLVDQAGSTMQEIVTSITRVTDIMSEIASASIEQTVGIDQINMAISQMDEVTQQNAALVEEAAAAAGSLQDQAEALAQAVSVFNVGTLHGREAVSKPAVMHRPPVAPRPPARPSNQAASKPSRLAVANGADPDWEKF